MLGRTLTAEEAKKIGLVTEVLDGQTCVNINLAQVTNTRFAQKYSQFVSTLPLTTQLYWARKNGQPKYMRLLAMTQNNSLHTISMMHRVIG